MDAADTTEKESVRLLSINDTYRMFIGWTDHLLPGLGHLDILLQIQKFVMRFKKNPVI